MMKWYQKLNIYFKTVFWTTIISLGISILLIPLFFFSLMEIPLGILLGAFIGILYYIAAGINEKNKYAQSAMTVDVILIVVRFILFAGALVGLALLYYVANIHIFNIFSFVGSYLLSLLVYLLVNRKEGKK